MALGFEAEIFRKITNNNDVVLDGDTPLVSHPWFELVSDKFNAGQGQYSNMEYVVGRIDQLAGNDQHATGLVADRVRAMLLMNDQLYAAQNTLANLVTDPQADGQAINFYVGPYGHTGALRVRNCPGPDAGMLHIHYTVGFGPHQWRRMLERILTVVRDNTANVRAKTHLTNGLAVADTIVNTVVNGDIANTGANAATVSTELRGHLALLYMHAMVWIDRTLNMQRDEHQQGLPATQAKFNQATVQLPFGDGQVKNKIAALPRATLAQMWGILSVPTRALLSNNVDAVLNAFAAKVEQMHGLDFPDNYRLDHPVAGSRTLVAYITSGLNGVNPVSQQVLFGAMTETGVDNAIGGNPLVPFEFRSLFNAQVTWGDLRADAIRVALWSRDMTRTLT